MPAAHWLEPVAVIRRLLDAPHGFEFFQAVRLLERWWAREEGLTRTQLLATRVAFRNTLSLSFPASEIESLRVVWRQAKAADDGAVAADNATAPAADAALPQAIDHIEMTPAFIGLLGAGGTLPHHYTETLALHESRQREQRGAARRSGAAVSRFSGSAARVFLDIFLHRTVALFYEAWRKHRLPIQFEADRRRHFLPQMLALAGLGHGGLERRLHAAEGGVADDALAHLAGPLQRRPVSARTLQQVLAYYFRVPVRLEQFVGRWFALPKTNQSTLGLANMALGRTVVLGERIWQRDLRMRLTLGPLSGERFARFLPGGPGALALRELLALLAGPTLEYEVRLALKAEDVHGAALDIGNAAPRLGWDSFLVTAAQDHDRADAGYDLLALA